MELLTKENYTEALWNLFGDDEDWNGNNGDDFTSDLALENGFATDGDFYISKAEEKYKETGDLEQAFKEVYDGYEWRNSNIYEMDYNTLEVNEGLVVAVFQHQYQ